MQPAEMPVFNAFPVTAYGHQCDRPVPTRFGILRIDGDGAVKTGYRLFNFANALQGQRQMVVVYRGTGLHPHRLLQPFHGNRDAAGVKVGNAYFVQKVWVGALIFERRHQMGERPFKIAALREGRAWTQRDWVRATVDTGVGNPGPASPEKGRRCFEEVSRKIGEFLVELAAADLDDLYER